MTKTLTYAGVLGAIIFVATEIIFYVSPEGRFPVYRTLLAVMLLAATIRSGSDLLNVAITSMGRDHAYAVTNVIGVVLALVFGAGFMWAFGLIGAGISAVATALSLLVIRGVYLRNITQPAIGAEGSPA